MITERDLLRLQSVAKSDLLDALLAADRQVADLQAQLAGKERHVPKTIRQDPRGLVLAICAAGYAWVSGYFGGNGAVAASVLTAIGAVIIAATAIWVDREC